MLHIQRWESKDKWETGLFHMAMSNVLTELFENQDGTVTLAFMETDYYAVGLSNVELAADTVERQLYYISSVCSQYFECETALYMSQPVTTEKAPAVWNQLLERSRENIALSPGIFHLERQKINPYTYRVPEIAQWAAFLKEGYPETMVKSAVSLLDKMVTDGRMNPKTLMVFQLDFVEMLRTVTDDGDHYIAGILNTSDKIEIYRNSARSVDGMKAFIQLAADKIQPQEDLFNTKTLVERITRYINEHLDGELSGMIWQNM